MIRVLIVADVRLYRDGLTHVLERRPGILVVGSASDGDQALGGAADLSPDVMLLDMAMPGAASTVQLLAGYGKYLRLAWNWRAGTIYERIVPRFARTGIASSVVPMLPRRLARYAQRSFLAMDRTPEAMFLDNFASIRLGDQRRLLGLGHEVHIFTSRLPPELPAAVRAHVFRPRRRRLPRFLRHTAFERWLRAAELLVPVGEL